MNNLLDILYILSGIYMMYAAIIMKAKGHITGNVLLKQGMTEDSIKDKDGFIQFLFGKVLFCGVVIVLAGAASLISSNVGGPSLVQKITFGIFVAVIIGYGIVTNKAMKKFV